MRGAGMQAAWDIFREFFDPGFVAFMDGVASEASKQGFVSVPEQWTKLVARHKAKQIDANAAPSVDRGPG